MPLAILLLNAVEAIPISIFNAVNSHSKGVIAAAAMINVIKHAATVSLPPSLFDSQM